MWVLQGQGKLLLGWVGLETILWAAGWSLKKAVDGGRFVRMLMNPFF